MARWNMPNILTALRFLRPFEQESITTYARAASILGISRQRLYQRVSFVNKIPTPMPPILRAVLAVVRTAGEECVLGLGDMFCLVPGTQVEYAELATALSVDRSTPFLAFTKHLGTTLM